MSKETYKNGNSLACLRNAGSHSAESYCTVNENYSAGFPHKQPASFSSIVQKTGLCFYQRVSIPRIDLVSGKLQVKRCDATYPGKNGPVWQLMSKKAVFYFMAILALSNPPCSCVHVSSHKLWHRSLYGHYELEWGLSAFILCCL